MLVSMFLCPAYKALFLDHSPWQYRSGYLSILLLDSWLAKGHQGFKGWGLGSGL